MNLLDRLNKRYDRVKEPARIFIMLALVMPGILLANTQNVQLMIAGWTWLFLLLAVRVSHIHKWIK